VSEQTQLRQRTLAERKVTSDHIAGDSSGRFTTDKESVIWQNRRRNCCCCRCRRCYDASPHAHSIWSRPRTVGTCWSATQPPLLGGVQVLVAAMSEYQGMTGRSPA
jgi:hypothetical protein